MARTIKTFFCVLLVISLCTGMALSSQAPVRVILDGSLLQFDVQPAIINGRTMVPLRAIFEAMDAEVEWDPTTQTAKATKGDDVVVLRIGDKSPTINGKTVPIDQPGVIDNGRTLAPMRFVAEAFGGIVQWHGQTNTASIETRAITTNPQDYGTFKNHNVSSVPVHISNESFTMYIPAGVPYRTDIEKRVLDYYNWVQAATGLSFHPPGTSYAKVHIDYAESGAYGVDSGITVNDQDYILDVPGAEYVYLHELLHTLQLRTVHIDNQPFVEAFAILGSAKVAKQQGLDYLYQHLMEYNYSSPPEEDEGAILANFERWYRTSRDAWDSYLFGFRFGVYLEGRYGDDVFQSLTKNYSTKLDGRASTQDGFVDFLIEQTDKNIFTDFVDWYRKNKAIFEEKAPPPVAEKEVVFMPIIHSTFRDFDNPYCSYVLNRAVLFDFFDSHALASFYGYAITGISGIFSVENEVTIQSYDLHGALLDTRVVGSGMHTLTFPDASTLTITGNDEEFQFRPNFTGCYQLK